MTLSREVKMQWHQSGNLAKFHYQHVDPDAAVAELERIKKVEGNRRPETIIEHAKHPRSPIHLAFDWDDNEAGKNWRRQQARALVASVEVTVRQSEEVTVPQYFSVKVSEGERDYLSLEEMRADAAACAEARRKLWKNALGLLRRSMAITLDDRDRSKLEKLIVGLAKLIDGG